MAVQSCPGLKTRACPPNCGNITTSVEQSLLISSLSASEFLLTRPNPEKACRQYKRNSSGKRNLLQLLDV